MRTMFSWLSALDLISTLLRDDLHLTFLESRGWFRILCLLTCMRAVNRQPKFTARGTRRAFSPPRAHGSALKTWKQTSTASILLLFHGISTFSWNLECFTKWQLFHKNLTCAWNLDFFMKSWLFMKSGLFHEIQTFSSTSQLVHEI